MEDNAATVSRPRKLEHVETILYEMDMLDYCYGRLRERKWADANDCYLCIDGFLLHYRNLIQFFGNHTGLRAEKPEDWSLNRKLSAPELASIQNSNLLGEYDGLISQYLCHCTPIRAERDIEWKHIDMYDKMAPLLTNFRNLFPSQPRTPKEILMLGAASVSTATLSSYASYSEDYSGVTTLKKPNA